MTESVQVESVSVNAQEQTKGFYVGTLAGSKLEHRSEAYQAGREDGHLEEIDRFVDNPHLAKWKTPSDRLTTGATAFCSSLSHSQNRAERWMSNNIRIKRGGEEWIWQRLSAWSVSSCS